jgi:hypothetical protein
MPEHREEVLRRTVELAGRLGMWLFGVPAQFPRRRAGSTGRCDTPLIIWSDNRLQGDRSWELQFAFT